MNGGGIDTVAIQAADSSGASRMHRCRGARPTMGYIHSTVAGIDIHRPSICDSAFPPDSGPR